MKPREALEYAIEDYDNGDYEADREVAKGLRGLRTMIAKVNLICRWVPRGSGTWTPGCIGSDDGSVFLRFRGGPFCPYCGGRIREVEP